MGLEKWRICNWIETAEPYPEKSGKEELKKRTQAFLFCFAPTKQRGGSSRADDDGMATMATSFSGVPRSLSVQAHPSPSLPVPGSLGRCPPGARAAGVVVVVTKRRARPVRSGQWPWRQSARALALRDGELSQLFAAILAWHAAWALSVATACVVSIWGRGDRGRAAPCRVPGWPDPCTGREHCTAGRRPARTKATKESYLFALVPSFSIRCIGWLVRVHAPAKFLFFTSTNKLRRHNHQLWHEWWPKQQRLSLGIEPTVQAHRHPIKPYRSFP